MRLQQMRRGPRCLRQFSTTSAYSVDFTHAVIGAGVVGLAIARKLAAKEGTSTVLIERNESAGMETSSRNSEVIHAGLYYGVDTLKTNLCVQGRPMLYDLCAKQSIPCRNTKKWIVAQTEQQWTDCLKLHRHAQHIGVPTRLVGREEGRRREAEVQAKAGIVESESTGIVDGHSLMTFLQGDLEEKGGDCAFRSPVTRVETLDGGRAGYRVYTQDRQTGEETAITAETLVNSAGLAACAINNMVLPTERHRTPYFAKGSYFSYAASHPKPSTLVYPAPEPDQGSLGTHLTLDLAGRVRFGPDLEWVDDATDLSPHLGRLEDAIRAVQTYLPGIDRSAVALDYCGIRPKLAGPGSGFQDFVIQTEQGFEGFVNLLGIESPGLTSSLAIAEMVERLLYR